MLGSLHRQAVPLDVTVSSFSPGLADHVRRLLPTSSGIRTALLGEASVRPSALLRQALTAGHDEIHPHVLALLADGDCVAAAHALGVAVVPWTVNSRRDVRRVARLGVDALITDVPANARATVGGSAAGPSASGRGPGAQHDDPVVRAQRPDALGVEGQPLAVAQHGQDQLG
jgi:glycerophosphoryl diester phosphodiesterase